ncbi:MAG: hypothetical protein P1V34_01850, partial [Alphaproteobacteria bacterium]|nr:hypothetical protein [Alphaproteobacteria bacterium]
HTPLDAANGRRMAGFQSIILSFRPGYCESVGMKTGYLFLLLSLFCAPALAQTVPDNPFTNATGKGSDATSRQGGDDLPYPKAKPDIMLRMSKKDCERVLRRANVPSADYVPNLDIRGNAVAGANLPGTLTAEDILPEEIAFELALNPFVFAGNTALQDLFVNSSTSFGTVRYNLASGKLTLNDKPLTPATEAEIVSLCQQAAQR